MVIDLKALAFLTKHVLLYATGSFLYGLVEILWRGHTHWSMLVIGGLCFVLIGLLNECYSWRMALLSQMVASAFLISCLEFFAGMLLNVRLGLGIWDYSLLPYNLHGQICLLYSNLWSLLSLPAILLDDWLRHWWFGEERPHYKVF